MSQDEESKIDEAAECEKASHDTVTDAQTSGDSEREDSAQSASAAGGMFDRAKIYLRKFANAAWKYIKQNKTELIVIVGLIILDLVTKAIVGKLMYVGQSKELIPDFLYITYVRNTKAAFGSAFGLEKVIGDNGIRIIFLIVTVIAVGVFCYLLYRLRRRHILLRLSLALIIAGAIGNFIDRLVFHYVRDFIEFVFLGHKLPLLGESFPVFNVADIALTVGVVIFLVYFIAIYKEPKAKPQSEPGQAAESMEASQGEPAEALDSDIGSDDNAKEHAEENFAEESERGDE